MSSAYRLSHDYKLPAELLQRVDCGALAVLNENWQEKTVEFHVPSLRSEDEQGRITTYSVIWIHPDHNARHCHYYTEQPGDLPNFYVTRETSDVGDDLLEFDTADDLISWLDANVPPPA